MTTTTIHRGRILQVPLDRTGAHPLYRQIYDTIRDGILSGRLPPGTRLPSTRDLARDLQIARSTVVQAFEQLRAEGYVEGVVGAATRVSRSLPDVHTRPAALTRQANAAAPRVSISERGRRILATSVRSQWVLGRPPRAFRAGVPAVDVFPVEAWGRILARRWNRTSSRLLAYGEPFGYQPLRAAVAEYLRAARGVRCSPEQVFIVAGSQQAIDLCARVLLDPGDTAWLEDPGYHGARGALAAAGARIVAVPVDAEGLVVSAGRKRAPDARLAFVTPSRQLPLGVTMSLARRLDLLEWAAGRAWIIEDDYDSEFRYASRPLAALQGLDGAGCVLYAGTFSKVMFPALRLGYLVVPEPLIDAFAAARHVADYHSPYLEQAAMADFMTAGHFERHIRRMRAIYQNRQAVLAQAAERELAEHLRVERADAGMTLIAWPTRHDDITVAQAAQRAGIDLLALTPFTLERPLPPGVLLGYAGVNEEDLRVGVTRLAAVFRTLDEAGARRPERGPSRAAPPARFTSLPADLRPASE
ncbi:MAG TPA: PLP-dependent aminotransferase family protein [Gemmatimonadaceae bacterium]|nr:PLP-dependent aminotransferase family protein [Gemmatimonadaceae bacterium]